MSGDERVVFERDVTVDEPGIVGARWWNRALADESAAVSRREALAKLLAGSAVLGAVGACGVGIAVATGADHDTRNDPSLDVQRRFGWNVGARDERMSLGDLTATTGPMLAADAVALREVMRPLAWPHTYDGSLFDAPDAMPAAQTSEETLPFHPLLMELLGGVSPSAGVARAVGAGLASLFAEAGARAALVVDLPGADSFALAAGAAHVFEPVALVHNWPHPRGVVASQRALASALAHRAYFVDGRTRRVGAPPPCFVLDRERLAPTAASDRFDNRYLVSLPSAATLRAGGIERVLYVVPSHESMPELDDLNADLVALAAAGLDVRAVAASSFAVTGEGTSWYGRGPYTHYAFWRHYPWAAPRPNTEDLWVNPVVRDWRPSPRPTRFSRAGAPADFGRVPLVVAGATVLGVAFDRRGSWHRSTSSWGGG